jgi:hypothetical protein
MEITKNRWWIFGLLYGAFMFVFMKVLLPISEGEALTFRKLLLGFLYWEVVGLVFGWIMSLINNRRKPTKDQS